jgi:hypothetical protein
MPVSSLTPLQVNAARLFFSLPESVGFAVAGGAALIAQGLIHRPTMDVDLFLLDASVSEIAEAAASFEAVLEMHGWLHRRVIDQAEFIRLEVSNNHESLIIDLGRDSPAEEPVEATDLGPTLSPRDLAARKTLALFGRAEARDFADVYDLAKRYGRDRLLSWAALDDAGFDKHVFAAMLTTIDRFGDEDLPVDPAKSPVVRAYFQDWADTLTRS